MVKETNGLISDNDLHVDKDHPSAEALNYNMMSIKRYLSQRLMYVLNYDEANYHKDLHNRHKKRQPLQEVQNLVNDVVQQEPPQQSQQPQQNTNGIIEWLFPTSIYQTQIGGRPMASNAWTIIASMWCRTFLLKTLVIPSNKSDIRAMTSSYKQTILNGNLLYQGSNLPHDQPNLEVRDVVNKIKDLNLQILHDLGFFNVDDIKETFVQMLQGGKRHAGVLIIPPANSVAIFTDNGNLAVFDSHQHGISKVA
ncbi:Hypothetical predicted protein [Paramuricea clavata]|uniref:Uncharacterized protein n=1 Tax=Paramuricea clavata TaxID=317549 RepID=A0A6S7G4F5_PARCT|nr:Hypothetical predicted protein [Paramuricea clavata]